MILGLDVSTSITGYTVLDHNGLRITSGFLDTRNTKGFYAKLDAQLDILTAIDDTTQVYVETPAKAFGKGKSSANTIATLQGFNAALCYALYQAWGIQPIHIAPTTARRLCGISVPRGSKAKQVVLAHLVGNELGFCPTYTRKGNPHAHWFDVADSIVIARAGQRSHMRSGGQSDL